MNLNLVALVNFDSRDWIAKIEVPTLVIGADKDLVFPSVSVKEVAIIFLTRSTIALKSVVICLK